MISALYLEPVYELEGNHRKVDKADEYSRFAYYVVLCQILIY